MYDKIKFFRRRQFILGPQHLEYQGWKKIKVEDNCYLTIHPDLLTTTVENENNKAILLGFIIDPYDPLLNEEKILRRFVTQISSVSDICQHLNSLVGRFVLLIKNNDNLWLFHDPCGLRQVNYYVDRNSAIWCASQPEVLAEYFGFQYDDETLSYRNMPAFKLTLEDFALIGNRTPFKEIKYLLANHYLDLKTGKNYRYWPYPGCIGSLSVNESVEIYACVLKNSIRAAAEKFNLKMGISAGCDSRKSLAASKEVKDKICYYTHTPESYNADIEIPARLLPKLGIKHYRIHIEKMDSEFKKLYELSATWARERHGHIAYTMLKNFGPDATILNSNISEYSQVQYWLPKSKINGKGLAILKGINNPVAIRDFQNWVDSAFDVCKASGMNILVLFQLELRSRWVANTLAECDIAYETFNPYNNRDIYHIELSVKERLRRGRRLDIPIKQIKHMWPEVLIEPINPEENLLKKFQKFIINKIIHKMVTPWFSIIDYLKYLKLKRQFNKP